MWGLPQTKLRPTGFRHKTMYAARRPLVKVTLNASGFSDGARRSHDNQTWVRATPQKELLKYEATLQHQAMRTKNLRATNSTKPAAGLPGCDARPWRTILGMWLIPLFGQKKD